ncbi:MAG: MFS transporter [Acetobacteraceae bacterium]|nr:MFS transporter [Acetobacteraceae bacterium]
MSVTTKAVSSVPWWREPTKDQWIAWIAAWLGWTLDAFDFTIFLLIMVPISNEFGVPLTAVAALFTITLWLRLVGATASGWLADRVGRKIPLMISILWYSLCNFIAGFAPSFAFLFFFRALLGIGMGAEWPAGASLAMESWPTRSRGFMSGVLQGSWGIGFLLSSLMYALLDSYIGWRGMLWLGILPALTVVWIRKYVTEPPVWLENRRKQREQGREVRMPLFVIFRRQFIWNTLTACWWMAASMCTYYSIWALFATHLQRDLGLKPFMTGAPLALANLVGFLGMAFWGYAGDRIGRRWSMILPAFIGLFITPTYLLTTEPMWILLGFLLQGLFAGAMYSQMPSFLTERFPTEIRATASAFCFHQATIFGGLVAPVLTYFAVNQQLGFAIPMLIGTTLGLINVCIALLLSPETHGREFESDLVVQV